MQQPLQYQAAALSMTAFVCSKVKMKSKRIHRTRTEGRPCINTSGIHSKEKVGKYTQALKEILLDPSVAFASERWTLSFTALLELCTMAIVWAIKYLQKYDLDKEPCLAELSEVVDTFLL